MTFLGESCKVDMVAAFKLPNRDRCKKLTIKNGKIIFNGKMITLSCDLTLDNTDIYDKNGNERTYGTDYTVNDGRGKYTFEVKAAKP